MGTIVAFGLIYGLVPVVSVAVPKFFWPGWQYGAYRDVIFIVSMVFMVGMLLLIGTHPAVKRWSNWLEGKDKEK
jgi:hypothetical protein